MILRQKTKQKHYRFLVDHIIIMIIYIHIHIYIYYVNCVTIFVQHRFIVLQPRAVFISPCNII